MKLKHCVIPFAAFSLGLLASCASEVQVKKVAADNYSVTGIPFTLMKPRAVVTPTHINLLQDAAKPAAEPEKTLRFGIELIYDVPDPNERYIINADPEVLSNLGIDLTFGTSGELLGSTETVKTEVPQLINTVANVVGTFIRGGASFDESSEDIVTRIRTALIDCTETVCADSVSERFKAALANEYAGKFDLFLTEYFAEESDDSTAMGEGIKAKLIEALQRDAKVCEDDKPQASECIAWRTFLARADRASLDAFIDGSKDAWDNLNPADDTAKEMRATAYALTAVSEIWKIYDLPPKLYRWNVLVRTEKTIAELQKCVAISFTNPPISTAQSNCSRILGIDTFPTRAPYDQTTLEAKITELAENRASLLGVREAYLLRSELEEALNARLNCIENCPRNEQAGEGDLIREIRTAIAAIDTAISERRSALAPPKPTKPKPKSYAKGPAAIFYWTNEKEVTKALDCAAIKPEPGGSNYLIVIETKNATVGPQLEEGCLVTEEEETTEDDAKPAEGGTEATDPPVTGSDETAPNPGPEDPEQSDENPEDDQLVVTPVPIQPTEESE